jgi:hypothetical protein
MKTTVFSNRWALLPVITISVKCNETNVYEFMGIKIKRMIMKNVEVNASKLPTCTS